MKYVGAVDIGGTFTDCTLMDAEGTVYTSKARSTPGDDFRSGFFESIERAGKKAGEEIDDLMDQLVRITHGTTVATNAIVEDEGADIGLLTTQGHEDTLTMMRGRGRVTGEPPENTLKVAEMHRPDPLVPREKTTGVTERVDDEGDVIVPLDEDQLEEAVDDLLAEGIDGLAVSFLWSFKHPDHERRVAEVVEERVDEDVYVSLSHEVSPTLGEYERAVATAVNASVGPLIGEYLGNIEETLREEYDFDGTFLLMGANGGCYTPSQAADLPIMLIGSGPVGGLKGCERLTAEAGAAEMTNVLATDMGGTSFELGIIRDGRPLVQEETLVQKYVYNIPKLDVESIGAGGGSIAEVSDDRIEVGPQSAGADPGPACYGRGGETPTVTDADLYLGYIDPEATFGTGELSPSVDLAEEALSRAGDRLGQSPLEFAAGIYEVTNTKMANLIEKNVIGRGYDPRDFSVISYGGAGPIHASAYANKLDVDSIVVPGEISPVWSAYGILNTDIRQEVEQEVVHLQPFDSEAVEADYRELESRGQEMLDAEGVDAEDVTFERYALMRFEGQYHELEIPAPSPIDDAEELAERFESEYRQRYSAAALFSEARAEIQSIRVEPVVEVETFERATMPTTDEIDDAAVKGTREVYSPSSERTVETSVYDGTKLRPGNVIEGPTVIDMSNTAIVAQADQTVRQNKVRDFVIDVGGDDDGD